MNILSIIMFFGFWYLIQLNFEPVSKYFFLAVYLTYEIAYFLTFIINPGIPDLNYIRKVPNDLPLGKSYIFKDV